MVTRTFTDTQVGESTKNPGVTQTYYLEGHSGTKYAIVKRQTTSASTRRQRERTARSFIPLTGALTGVGLPYPRFLCSPCIMIMGRYSFDTR